MQIQKAITKKVPLLGSSVDPNKIALTVKGVLLGLLPVILIALKAGGIEVGESDVKNVIDGIVNVVLTTSALASAIMVVWGGVRKIINR